MRPTREQTLIETAYLWSNRGTCPRLQVGCVIHREGRILVQGYNGAPSGLPHCVHGEWHYDGMTPIPQGLLDALGKLNEKLQGSMSLEEGSYYYWDDKSVTVTPTPNAPGCTQAVHAEQNAITFAARYGVALEDAELVVTHQPCGSCAMSIINAGLKKVTYVEKYRLHDGVDLLNAAGIEVVRFVEPPLPKMIG